MAADKSMDGQEQTELHEALLDAFRSKQRLEIMVQHGLGANLEEIALTDSLSSIVFKLIEWAEETGNLPRLVAAAIQENPGNQRLRAVATRRGIPCPEPALLPLPRRQWKPLPVFVLLLVLLIVLLGKPLVDAFRPKKSGGVISSIALPKDTEERFSMYMHLGRTTLISDPNNVEDARKNFTDALNCLPEGYTGPLREEVKQELKKLDAPKGNLDSP
jgi:hypothetical protein